MPRKHEGKSKSSPYQQLALDFESVIQSADVLSREEVVAQSHQGVDGEPYSPVAQTADYMKRAVQFEEAWETTVQQARLALLEKDARELYFEFITDLKYQIEQGVPKAPRLAHLLEQVAIRGLGIRWQHLRIAKPQRGGTRWRVNWNPSAIEKHLEEHIIGPHFFNPISIDDNAWKNREPLIGASDVSQHRSAVPIPARFFKRSVPFVLNNAAGTLFKLQDGDPKYDNLFDPKPNEELLRWMLIDPSYQDELEPEDYQRCLASAMDVGQYKFDHTYLLKADKNIPDIIFRDGSLFPQDAYLDNFVAESRRGEFTREAIREMLNCLMYARELGIIYCGVTKNVQLRAYSAVVDWFIAQYIDPNWELGSYTLNDGQAMSLLLASPEFVGDNLQNLISTCLIRRSFTTRANLNTRANLDDLESHFQKYRAQYGVDLRPYKQLCKMAHVYMFFIGHSKSPQQQLPRYEFFYADTMGSIATIARKVLAGLQHCGLGADQDHSFMADTPIIYLIPRVTQQAHSLSKDVGKYIDTNTGQWIMARYRSMLQG
jgi:hypothetical protein